MSTAAFKPSPDAAQALITAVEAGLSMFGMVADDLVGATDCPDGCQVERDGYCGHGFWSAQETMLRTVA
jgi:hypothetical protein